MKTTRDQFCRSQKGYSGGKMVLCQNTQGFWLMRFHKGDYKIKEKKKTFVKCQKYKEESITTSKKQNVSIQNGQKIEKIRDLIGNIKQNRKKISEYNLYPSFPKIEKKKEDNVFLSEKLNSPNEDFSQTLKKKKQKKNFKTIDGEIPTFIRSYLNTERKEEPSNRIKIFKFQEMNTLEHQKRSRKGNPKKSQPIPLNQSHSSRNSPEKLSYENPLQTIKLQPEHKTNTGINFFPKKAFLQKKVPEQRFINSTDIIRNTVDAWEPKQEDYFDSSDFFI